MYRFISSCNLPTQSGMFEMRVYKQDETGQDAIAMVARVRHGTKRHRGGYSHSSSTSYSSTTPGDATLQSSSSSTLPPGSVCVRVQDQCVTSEIFGSVKCDCKQQLDFSLELLTREAKRRWEEASTSRSAVLFSSSSSSSSSAVLPLPLKGEESKQIEKNEDGDDDVHLGNGSIASSSRTSVASSHFKVDSDSESGGGGGGGGESIEGRDSEEGQSSGTLSVVPVLESDDSSTDSQLLEIEAHGASRRKAKSVSSSNNHHHHHHHGKSIFIPPLSSLPTTPTTVHPDKDNSIVGCVVYLLQEGRGIGLAAKVSAYALQEEEEVDEEDQDDDDHEDEEEMSENDDNGKGAGQPHVHAHSHADDTPVSSSRDNNNGSGSSSSSSATELANNRQTQHQGEKERRRAGRRRRKRAGLDTVEANRALGLPDDTRVYGAVADILLDLGLMNKLSSKPIAGTEVDDDNSGGVVAVTPNTSSASSSLEYNNNNNNKQPTSSSTILLPLYLLTNNPRKVDKLREIGIPLAGRLPCHTVALSPLAAAYMRTKVERMGHDIPQHFFAATL